MKSLKELRPLADEALGGLNAGPELKLRVLNAAKRPYRHAVYRLAAVSFCVLAAAAAVIFITLPEPDIQQEAPRMVSIPGGASEREPFVRAYLDLPPGSITLGSGSALPEYRSIWAPKSGANFPLIAVKGRYYRLMKNPSSLPQSLVGELLGTVESFVDEPALAPAAALISNIVSEGEAVYTVKGVPGACAALVEGRMRVFQRVSFANNTLVGGEKLADTLVSASSVTGLELSGKGTVTDPATVSALMKTLLGSAVYAGASPLNVNQSLLIQLDNGLTLQMLIRGETLSACGNWTCPEFFEAFAQAVP